MKSEKLDDIETKFEGAKLIIELARHNGVKPQIFIF